jgi:hypothetical protein
MSRSRSTWAQRNQEPDLHFVADSESAIGDTTSPLAELLLDMLDHGEKTLVLPIRSVAPTATSAAPR